MSMGLPLPAIALRFGRSLELLETILNRASGTGLAISTHVLGHGFVVDGDVLSLKHAEEELAVGSRWGMSVLLL